MNKLTIKAAVHEIHCAMCRVTWKSWLQRIVGIRRGFSPAVKR